MLENELGRSDLTILEMCETYFLPVLDSSVCTLFRFVSVCFSVTLQAGSKQQQPRNMMEFMKCDNLQTENSCYYSYCAGNVVVVAALFCHMQMFPQGDWRCYGGFGAAACFELLYVCLCVLKLCFLLLLLGRLISIKYLFV